jgi:uncharacterized membrane protein YkgB
MILPSPGVIGPAQADRCSADQGASDVRCGAAKVGQCRNPEMVATRSRKRSPLPAINSYGVPSARCRGCFRSYAVAKENDTMIKDFNVSEKGHGSYWPLGILRWVMVLIFISFGIQKFTPQSAQGIALYISNSPFVSWLSVFGIRGEADLLGIIELTTGALLAAGAFIPILSALGSLIGIGTFAITWSFFFSTPGVVEWSVSTDPIAWNLTGEFLFKDVVLLCVCVVLFLASLPKKVVPLRLN